MAHCTSVDLSEIERHCRTSPDLSTDQLRALQSLTSARDARRLSLEDATELVFSVLNLSDTPGQIGVLHALRDLAQRPPFQSEPVLPNRSVYGELARITDTAEDLIVEVCSLLCDLAITDFSRHQLIISGMHELLGRTVDTTEAQEPVVAALSVLTRLAMHSRGTPDYAALARLGIFRVFERNFDAGQEDEVRPRPANVDPGEEHPLVVHRRRVALANERVLAAWGKLLTAMISYENALTAHEDERDALLFTARNIFRFARDREIPAVLRSLRRWIETDAPDILAWFLEAEVLDVIVDRYPLAAPDAGGAEVPLERLNIYEESKKLIQCVVDRLARYEGDLMYPALFRRLLANQHVTFTSMGNAF